MQVGGLPVIISLTESFEIRGLSLCGGREYWRGAGWSIKKGCGWGKKCEFAFDNKVGDSHTSNLESDALVSKAEYS